MSLLTNPWVALLKPRLASLAVLSGLFGWYLGQSPTAELDWIEALIIACCLILIGGGANTLNQVIEHQEDSQMDRTQSRPLPQGQLNRKQALVFGLMLPTGGLIILAFHHGLSTAAFGLLTLLSYVLLYTPMKKKSSLNTLVGAIPGCLPPLIGYSASQAPWNLGIAIMAAILFVWQMPHFLAIAWIYREDYSKAGFPMLSVIDNQDGQMTGRQIVLYTLALLPLSLCPSVFGYAGPLYFMGALFLGLLYLALSFFVLKGCQTSTARLLFVYSITYLPLVMLLWAIDKKGFA